MKHKFINSSYKAILRYHPEYDEKKLDRIKYGLESIYLTTTKMIIISAIAIYLNIFKEMLVMLLSINIFRTSAFGIHAKTSFKCLISTSLILLVPAYFIYNINLDIYTKSLLCILSLIAFYLYAPADTEKFPLIKEKKRNSLKFQTVIKCIIISFVILLLNNVLIINSLLIGMVIESIMILPITYKIFDQPYANYKAYLLNKKKEGVMMGLFVGLFATVASFFASLGSSMTIRWVLDEPKASRSMIEE